jgi:hypothetical protein
MRAIIRNENDRDQFILYVLQADLKRPYEASYKVHRKTRSLASNRLLWKWLHCISDETGQDTRTLYHYFCGKYISVEIKEVFGQQVQEIGGSSKLDSKQFSKFLDCIKVEMNEMGIYLPEPGQVGWDEFVIKYADKKEGSVL